MVATDDRGGLGTRDGLRGVDRQAADPHQRLGKKKKRCDVVWVGVLGTESASLNAHLSMCPYQLCMPFHSCTPVPRSHATSTMYPLPAICMENTKENGFFDRNTARRIMQPLAGESTPLQLCTIMQSSFGERYLIQSCKHNGDRIGCKIYAPGFEKPGGILH